MFYGLPFPALLTFPPNRPREDCTDSARPREIVRPTAPDTGRAMARTKVQRHKSKCHKLQKNDRNSRELLRGNHWKVSSRPRYKGNQTASRPRTETCCNVVGQWIEGL